MKLIPTALHSCLFLVALLMSSLVTAQADQVELKGVWSLDPADQNYEAATFNGVGIDSVKFSDNSFQYYLASDSTATAVGNYFKDGNELTFYFVEPASDPQRYTIKNLTNELLVLGNDEQSLDFVRTVKPLETSTTDVAQQDFASTSFAACAMASA